MQTCPPWPHVGEGFFFCFSIVAVPISLSPCRYVATFSRCFGLFFVFISMGAGKSLRTCAKASTYRPNRLFFFEPVHSWLHHAVKVELEHGVLFYWLILLPVCGFMGVVGVVPAMRSGTVTTGKETKSFFLGSMPTLAMRSFCDRGCRLRFCGGCVFVSSCVSVRVRVIPHALEIDCQRGKVRRLS